MTSEEDFIEIPNTDLFDQWFSYPDEEQLGNAQLLLAINNTPTVDIKIITNIFLKHIMLL